MASVEENWHTSGDSDIANTSWKGLTCYSKNMSKKTLLSSDVVRIYKVYLNNLYWAQSYSPEKENAQFVRIGRPVLELCIKT